MTAPSLTRKGYEQPARVARKDHHCWDCGRLIPKGERYIAYTATPRHDVNGTGNWMHAAFCRNCTQHDEQWATPEPSNGD